MFGFVLRLVARSTRNGISLTWVKSVDPVAVVDADSYEVHRANYLGGDSKKIAHDVTVLLNIVRCQLLCGLFGICP